MKNFLIYTLATITGIILASLLFFFIMIASLGAIIASGDKPVMISNNSVLVLKAGVPIPDRGNPSPWSGFDLANMTFSPTTGLNDILNNIRKASSDPKIKGILIENGLLSPGWATSDEIRTALEKFKTSGKFIIAWADYTLSQEGYFLSTAADKIFLSPSGIMEFKGLSGEVMFFKKALGKIGIDIQVIRHGKFKGAVEPFLLDEMSKENREQISEYIGSIWKHAVSKISLSRNISEEKLNLLASNLTASDADDALSNNLIDGLIYRDALIDTLKIRSGLSVDQKIELVSMSRYSKLPDPARYSFNAKRIVVIYAEGNISMGKGNDSNIGGNYYADVIREQRKDTNIKAIVLRINSPGGVAIASDFMWRELDLASKVKPVVVSMGNYAASGGYYIAAPATKIYADATSISGSIGVFMTLPNTGKLLNEKLGISIETVNTNSNSDFPSIFRSASSYEKEILQKGVEKFYNDFVAKVAAGRKMRPAAVDSVGQGRVWTGIMAKDIGLVDEIGGIDEAIKGAAQLAGIEKYTIREFPILEDPYTKLLSGLTSEIRMRTMLKELGENAKYYAAIKEITVLSGMQARLPYLIEIR
jgi:protease IV